MAPALRCSGSRGLACGLQEPRFTGFSCFTARAIFPDEGLSPCPLHRQADSYLLYHQGSPTPGNFRVMLSCSLFVRSFIISSLTRRILSTVSEVHRLTFLFLLFSR